MDVNETVRRFAEEAGDDGQDVLIEELFAPEAVEAARAWFGAFRRFPGGHPPTGRRFKDVKGVYFFLLAGNRIAGFWGLEDSLDRYRQLGSDLKTG